MCIPAAQFLAIFQDPGQIVFFLVCLQIVQFWINSLSLCDFIEITEQSFKKYIIA